MFLTSHTKREQGCYMLRRQASNLHSYGKLNLYVSTYLFILLEVYGDPESGVQVQSEGYKGSIDCCECSIVT